MDSRRMWVRVDNRLVHGQVVETWLPYSKANVMVLANDDIVADQLRQEIIKLAIPSGVDLMFTCIAETAQTLEWYCEHHVCSQVFQDPEHRKHSLCTGQGSDLRSHRPQPGGQVLPAFLSRAGCQPGLQVHTGFRGAPETSVVTIEPGPAVQLV